MLMNNLNLKTCLSIKDDHVKCNIPCVKIENSYAQRFMMDLLDPQLLYVDIVNLNRWYQRDDKVVVEPSLIKGISNFPLQQVFRYSDLVTLKSSIWYENFKTVNNNRFKLLFIHFPDGSILKYWYSVQKGHEFRVTKVF